MPDRDRINARTRHRYATEPEFRRRRFDSLNQWRAKEYSSNPEYRARVQDQQAMYRLRRDADTEARIDVVTLRAGRLIERSRNVLDALQSSS